MTSHKNFISWIINIFEPKTKKEWYTSITVLMLIVISVGCSFAIPQLLQYIIDTVLPHQINHHTLVLSILTAYGIGWTLTLILTELREVLSYDYLISRICSVISTTIGHLYKVPYLYHTEQRTGELIANIKRVEKTLLKACISALFIVIPYLLESIILLGYLFKHYPPLFGIIFLSALGLSTIFFIATSKKLVLLNKISHKSENNLCSAVLDCFINIDTIKNSTTEILETERISEYAEKAAISRATWYIAQEKILLGQQIIIGTSLLLITFFAGRQVILKTLHLGEFILLNSYLAQISIPLSKIGWTLRHIKEGLFDGKELFAILQEPIEEDINESLLPSHYSPELTFTTVSFSPTNRANILKNLDFTIQRGRSCAIVGLSGGGKSTIGKLLMRFFDPQEGTISWDNMPLKNIKKKALRASIHYVLQETLLFKGTIEDNIAYGKKNITKALIIEAAKLACIHDFIQSLPNGYQTMLGELGSKISGGERQRIILARAFLAHATLYIFDEATAALDNMTEAEVMHNIKEHTYGKTTIFIAHRLKTIVDVDSIIVLDQGTVAEQGTHEELLAQNGIYATLWNAQKNA